MNNQDPSEMIRIKLNELPEKDIYENDSRFSSQFVTWIFGAIAESTKNQDVQRLGTNLRRGAEKSFGDLIGQKIAEEINKLFRN